MNELSAEERSLLLDAANRLAALGYQELSYLQDIPYIEERKQPDGTLLIIRAEAREEPDPDIDGGLKLIVPIELWRGREVHWIHLFAHRDGRTCVDDAICSNPPG